jgi:glutathione peroxidase-family protein
MITTFDKKDLKNLTRYVYVPWPQVQEYQEFDDYDEHSIADIGDSGACIEEDWLYEHTPDHEGCSYEEIAEFCRLNHGVTFPLMAKSDVNGENANEVFKWLYSEKPFAGFGDSDSGKFMDGMLSRGNPDYASNPDIKWNFTKFLLDRKGRVVARFEPVVTPAELEAHVEALL